MSPLSVQSAESSIVTSLAAYTMPPSLRGAGTVRDGSRALRRVYEALRCLCLPSELGGFAVAFPQPVEHRIHFRSAELPYRIDVLACSDESVFRPDSIADHRAQGALLKGCDGVYCFGLDHLSRASEID